MHLKLEDHINSLSPETQEKIGRMEYPKTETEHALIQLANAESNRLMKEVGVEPYDIPSENYHIVPPDIYKEVSDGSGAVAVYMQQAAMFNAPFYRGNSLHFMSSALHETLHLKGHFSLEVEENGNNVHVTQYRSGLSVYAAQKRQRAGEHHLHLRGLHEAVVAEQEKHSFPSLLDAPILKKEKEWYTLDETQAMFRRVSEKTRIPSGDLIWAEERKDKEYNYIDFGYPAQRKTLRYVCEEIFGQFQDTYQSPDAVFKEFLKAQFTGRLLPIARLVEETFGAGGFRTLGSMGIDQGSATLALEALKKARTRFKKKDKD